MSKRITYGLTTVVSAWTLLIGASLNSQAPDSAPKRTTTAALPITLEISATVPVTNLYAAELNAPAVCAADGTLYANLFVIRTDESSGQAISHQTIVGIDPHGKITLSVAAEQITDIENPRITNYFPTEDALYLLIHSSGHGNSAENRKNLFHKSDSDLEFIARFDRDGAYRGATRIDLPISALQLGVFPTGQFVIAGIDDFTHAKVILLKPSGVFDRYIDLKKSGIDELSASAATEPPLGNRAYVAGFSRLVANGPDILLVSPDSTSLFKLRNSGTAEQVRLRAGYSGPLNFLALRDGWLVQRRAAVSKEDKSLLSTTLLQVAPDGRPLRNYVLSHRGDLTLACMSDQEITFLQKDNEGKLLLIVTSPNRNAITIDPASR
jgi:hypothetical protein